MKFLVMNIFVGRAICIVDSFDQALKEVWAFLEECPDYPCVVGVYECHDDESTLVHLDLNYHAMDKFM